MKKFTTFRDYVKLNESESKIDEFFGKIFQSRDVAHLNHLSTKSYARHKALNEYYDEIVDLMDKLIEAYQGKFDIINITVQNSKTNQFESIDYFNDLNSFIKSQKDVLFEDSELLGMVDDIISLIDTTLYKLKELK